MEDIIFRPLVEIILGLSMDAQGTDPSLLKVSDETIALMNPIWNYLSIFGLSLSIIYFLIEMNKKYMFEARDMNFKSMALPFLKLAISVIVLSQGATMVSYFLGWHNSFIDWADNTMQGFNLIPELKDSTGSTVTSTTVADKLLDSLNGVTMFFAGIMLIVQWVVALVVSFIWNYKSYAYQFELLYRVGITPIALADIYSNSQAAAKWLKGFLGLALYGAAFIVIPRLGVILSVTQLQSAADALTQEGGGFSVFAVITAFLGMLLVPIAELGIMGTVKQLCKEVCA